MDALLICGGRGTRLEAAVEKPLFRVAGRPMVDRVADAVRESRIDTTYAVTAPQAPETREHVRERGLPTVETPGDGYVADLRTALADERVQPPVLTVAADLPLLDGPAVDAVLDAYERRTADRSYADPPPSLTVTVPVETKERLGVGVDTAFDGRAPAGINVVSSLGDGDASEEPIHVTEDPRYAVNVNRRADAAVAEQLLDDGAGTPGENAGDTGEDRCD